MAFKFYGTFSGDAPPFATALASGTVTEGDLCVGASATQVAKIGAVAIPKGRIFLCLKTATTGLATNLILLSDDVILSCTATAANTIGAPVELDFTKQQYGATLCSTSGVGGVCYIGSYSEQTSPSTAVTKFKVVIAPSTV